MLWRFVVLPALPPPLSQKVLPRALNRIVGILTIFQVFKRLI
jgi:hypothetical protein